MSQHSLFTLVTRHHNDRITTRVYSSAAAPAFVARVYIICAWCFSTSRINPTRANQHHHSDPTDARLTISEVAVDWQEPMVLQCKCGHPLPALTDTGPAVAASKHTTAPINHTRPSPRNRSWDVATSTEIADTRLLLTTHLSTTKGWKAELA